MHNEVTCDGCGTTTTLEQGYYHFLGTVQDQDLCKKCYDNIESLYTQVKAECQTCDICQQYITKGKSNHIGLDDIFGFDMCQTCKSNPDIDVRKMLVFLNTDTDISNTLCYTERDHTYLYYGRDQLEIPDSIRHRIVDFTKDDLDCVVRPPSYDWNAGKWQYIDDFKEVPCYDAMCCWAVRCETGHPHQVASVVSDNHGRIAFNIFYQDVDSFLQAEKNWKDNILLPESERQTYLKEVQECFNNTFSCEEELIAKATDNFAVYERLNRNVSLYYG